MAPDFLQLADVLLIHADQIDRYGGESAVREVGLLESAIAQPRATIEGAFLHRDVFEMAAAYLFHLVQNHPFVDGNKRTGAATALVFLELNGVAIEADEDDFAALVLDVAQGRADKARIAEYFRAASV
ncbi:MAG: type II toxin-antitoxin system death-on-curing family toxin [Phycisphaerae bacterium]